MYTSITRTPLRDLVLAELPAFATALVIAELLYKFRSFSLELVAFLITWFVLGWATRQLISLRSDH